MFIRIFRLVAQGLLALLPISLTIYFLYWAITTTEAAILPLIPSHIYFPGLGLIVGIGVLFCIGLLVNAYVFKMAIRWGERSLEHIPLVKSVYGMLKDTVSLITISKEQKTETVVSVEISPTMHLIGFVTSDEGAKKLFNNDKKIGVYVPLSYQIGGYTLYIERDKITPLNIEPEIAMRIALTGGSSTNHGKPPKI